jgi:hypothetical protein
MRFTRFHPLIHPLIVHRAIRASRVPRISRVLRA